MSKQQAKSFILAMIEAGSNIQAIGKTGYVRAEPVVIDDEEAFKRIDRVAERFGNVASPEQRYHRLSDRDGSGDLAP
ncbi:hypothetical protein ACLJYM_24060 [Rhizobium giardinii]|uniref:hypothetical protein n=1 Tax=Rhizobium giardinii TaxID=56731 RepID=UPI0039DFB1CE